MYKATITKPFELPTVQQDTNLRRLLKSLRILVVTSTPGTAADVELVENDEHFPVVRYENSEGKLKKIS